MMNADGSGATRLTNNPAEDIEPAWSPDGTKIAFKSYRDVPNGDIYVMNADGTGQTRLTNGLGDDRSGHLWPLGMTAGSSPPPLASGAEVLVPGTEVDGVADAMIEAQCSKNFCWTRKRHKKSRGFANSEI